MTVYCRYFLSKDGEIAAVGISSKIGLLAVANWNNQLDLYKIGVNTSTKLDHNVELDTRFPTSVVPTALALAHFETPASSTLSTVPSLSVSSPGSSPKSCPNPIPNPCPNPCPSPSPSVSSHPSPLLFLLIGFSNGSVFHAGVPENGSSHDKPNHIQFTDINHFTAGTCPVSLHPIAWNDLFNEGIAICSDQPAVMFLGASRRLQAAALGISHPNCISKLDLPVATDDRQALISWTAGGIVHFGLIEGIQRLQIKTLPLGMSPEW